MMPSEPVIRLSLARRRRAVAPPPPPPPCPDECECAQETFVFFDDFCSFPGFNLAALPSISANGQWTVENSGSVNGSVTLLDRSTGWWRIHLNQQAQRHAALLKSGRCLANSPGTVLRFKAVVAQGPNPVGGTGEITIGLSAVSLTAGFTVSPSGTGSPNWTPVVDGSIGTPTAFPPSSDCKNPDVLEGILTGGNLQLLINGNIVFSGPVSVSNLLEFFILLIAQENAPADYDIDLVCASMPRVCIEGGFL